ncbi:MAG: MBL fold metallo-hydrolase [Proteobacteria bacterium]|nr:MBL fold metallo-hydrolase [Pseudomonadota bacterium]
MIFHQLYEAQTSTYSYLLADAVTKEAVIIDPVLDMAERDLQLIQELGLTLLFAIDTHIHADHITGAGLLREKTGAQTAISASSQVSCADILLQSGDLLRFGRHVLRAVATPGHTHSCMSFIMADMVFTGDALLIRGSGRTDFQQGSADTLYESVHQQLFVLPDETKVYPAHDYRGLSYSTIGLEKKFNKRLGGGKSKDEYRQIMAGLNLAYPKKIDMALPANLACGQIPKV